MRFRHAAFGLADRIRYGLASGDILGVVQCRAQHGARVGIVRDRQRRAGHGNFLAIGFDKGRVDAVERGAAHQPNDFLPYLIFVGGHPCYRPGSFIVSCIPCPAPVTASNPTSSAPSWSAAPITTARRLKAWTRSS